MTEPLLVIGNWKMNPATLGAAKKLFMDLRRGLRRRTKGVRAVVAPPFPFISEIERLNPSQRFGLSAQDIYFETSGAHTGEVSLPMVKSVGVTYVIVGHSERRARGETDEEIYRDIEVIAKHKVTAVVCVGERERDPHGNYFTMVEAQVRAALARLPKNALRHVVIAYEPIWAIGTGVTATAEDAREMKIFIQRLIADLHGRAAVGKVRVLYGGSVNPENAAELLATGGVDGFLVGGASLRAADFISIIHTAERHAKNATSSRKAA